MATALNDQQRTAVVDLFETCEEIRELYATIVLYGQTHHEAVLGSHEAAMCELLVTLKVDIDFAEEQGIEPTTIVHTLEDRLPPPVFQKVMGT